MALVQLESETMTHANSARGQEVRAGSLLLTTLWIGMVAGWLELGFVLAQSATYPRVSVETLRTNRHLVWMIPVSEFLLFGIVAVVLFAIARPWHGLATWLALRLPVALGCLTVLLNIEGLYTIASVTLACGLGSVIGAQLSKYSFGFRRAVRLSFPAMVVGAIVFVGVMYMRVQSAERRALALCPPAKPGAPNVLLIVLDTVRASCLSLYGHNRVTTPNLDRLANKGVVFREARSTAPWTSPTHASMLTGRWPHELSIAPGVPLDRSFPTLAEVLGREGYATAGFVGNIYYCSALYGMGRGFARYEDAYENQTVSLFETMWSSGLGRRIVRAFGHSTQLDDGVALRRKSAEMLNRDVLGWLAKRPANQPFFAFINYYDAHRPYVLNDNSDLLFGMAKLSDEQRREIDARFEDFAAGKPTPAGFTPQQISNDALDLCHDSYDSSIAYLDRQVGLLLDEIERRGLLENTLVIVTSDHGEALGERGLVTHGSSVYREEVHVPLLIIPPARSAKAVVVDEPVSLREIPATIAEWASLDQNHAFPGRSLTRFMNDAQVDRAERSPVLSELEHNIAFPPRTQIPSPFGPARSLVWRDRVYIRKDDGGEELYDLVNDPGETADLAKLPHSLPMLHEFRKELGRIQGRVANSAP